MQAAIPWGGKRKMIEETRVIYFVLMLTKGPVIIGRNNSRKCKDYKGENGVRNREQRPSVLCIDLQSSNHRGVTPNSHHLGCWVPTEYCEMLPSQDQYDSKI